MMYFNTSNKANYNMCTYLISNSNKFNAHIRLCSCRSLPLKLKTGGKWLNLTNLNGKHTLIYTHNYHTVTHVIGFSLNTHTHPDHGPSVSSFSQSFRWLRVGLRKWLSTNALDDTHTDTHTTQLPHTWYKFT
jgi:hypothetical protein